MVPGRGRGGVERIHSDYILKEGLVVKVTGKVPVRMLELRSTNSGIRGNGKHRMRFRSFGAVSGCIFGPLPISPQPVIGGNPPLKKTFLLSERVSLQREDTSMRSIAAGPSTG